METWVTKFDFFYLFLFYYFVFKDMENYGQMANTGNKWRLMDSMRIMETQVSRTCFFYLYLDDFYLFYNLIIFYKI